MVRVSAKFYGFSCDHFHLPDLRLFIDKKMEDISNGLAVVESN